MKRLERALKRLEELLEGGSPMLISVGYELPDGHILWPGPEEKLAALARAKEEGRDYAVAYPEERP